ncbi:MAG: 3-keto-5-aminohexanoate cleavage protein [Desulfobacterales bacterium]|jgi:3-keto-5-aminohexanoate cleavage enzyme
MKRKIMITVAPVARVANPDDDVINPLTPEEIAEEVFECTQAGASQVHLHVRMENGEITHLTDVYSRTLDMIRDKSDILIQGSTGGFEKDLNLDERCSAIDDDRTQIASLNMGSLNFGEDLIFQNPEVDIEYWANRMYSRGVVPELEIFNAGMICTIERFIEKGVLKPPLNCNFPMGYYTSIQPTVESVIHMRNTLPPDCNFGITHNAMTDFSLVAASIALGAVKARVGFEDSIYYAPGQKGRTNAVLVRKMAQLIEAMGCEVMNTNEARELYGAK